MKEILYYPGFEIENEDWLKFALLYVDRLRPIVPESGLNTLSDNTYRIMEETDLIDYYNPSFRDSNEASTEVLRLIDEMLTNPKFFSSSFYGRNPSTYLTDDRHKDFLLYREKCNDTFIRFCLENNLAIEYNDGILMNKHVGNIYMSILASIISDYKNLECITDNYEMDKYNIYIRNARRRPFNINSGSRRPYNSNKVINIARTNINLSLPCNLNNIDIDVIVELRNSTDYKRKLHAFHRELDKYVGSLEENEYNTTFVDSLSESLFDVKNELAQLGPNLFSFILGLSFSFNGSLDAKDLIGTSLIGGAVTSSFMKIIKLRRENEDVRYARKYMSTLAKIPL